MCLLRPTWWFRMNSDQRYQHIYSDTHIQVVPGQAVGGSFNIETLIAYRAGQRLCLQVTAKPSVLRSNKLLTCQSDAMSFECSIFSHLTWPHRIAASLGNCSLHPIVTAVFVIPSHLISSHLSLAQLFSAGHNCPLLISCHLSLSHLFSSSHSFSQILTALNSAKLSAAHVSSSFVFSPSLSSSHIFWALLTSPQLISALVSSSHLISALLSSSQRTLKSSQPFSGPKPAQNKDLGAKASDPYAFHREDLTQRTFTQQELVHTKAYTQRHASFNTETGKLVHRDTEAFTHNKLLHRASFYTQQTYACRSFCTQKLLHREALTQRRFYTQHAFTHRNFMKLLHREA